MRFVILHIFGSNDMFKIVKYTGEFQRFFCIKPGASRSACHWKFPGIFPDYFNHRLNWLSFVYILKKVVLFFVGKLLRIKIQSKFFLEQATRLVGRYSAHAKEKLGGYFETVFGCSLLIGNKMDGHGIRNRTIYIKY